MRVLSIDPGLRNLALAVVKVKTGWTFPDANKTLAAPDESTEAFKRRAMLEFLRDGWVMDHLEVIDISKMLGRKVSDIKRMPLTDKVTSLCATLQRVETDWFDAENVCPDVLVVEVQHNANPEMKAVAMAAMAFLHRSMPDTQLRAITGVHKLKICEALGFPEGSGLTSRQSRSRSRPLPSAKKKGSRPMDADADADSDLDPENDDGEDDEDDDDTLRVKKGFRKVADKWVRTKQGCLDKYYDNKHRSMLALKRLLPTYKTAKGVKKDDVADALLQALWILWEHVEPPKPRKQTNPKPSSTKPKIKTSSAGRDSAPPPPKRRKTKTTRECFIDLSLTPTPT
jgi:hypothetical protein